MDLPYEVLLEILKQLHLSDLLQVQLACADLSKMAQEVMYRKIELKEDKKATENLIKFIGTLTSNQKLGSKSLLSYKLFVFLHKQRFSILLRMDVNTST